MNETQKSIIWMLVVGAAFLGGTLFQQYMDRSKSTELSVISSIPVLTQDMVRARAAIYVHPLDPDYFCFQETAHSLSSGWPAQFLMHRPSRVRQISRKLTRRNCGRPITILIDVGKLKTDG